MSRAKISSSHPIAIVGGGLGGLALAIGLLKHDIHVQIYEAAPTFSEIGAGVAFGPNATWALDLIDNALLEGYKKHATFNEDSQRDSTFLTFRWGMDERKRGGKKVGDVLWDLKDRRNPGHSKKLGVRTRSCIHRARLLDVLVGLLPKGITSFGKSFEGVETMADGNLELYFADGTTTVASAMIGCDGIKSKAREIVCGQGVGATYAGEYAYRAMVPKLEAERALGAELARNGQLYCGYGAYIVTYPVEHGEFTNMVAIPLEQDQSNKWVDDEWTIPAPDDGEFLRHFEGWNKSLIDLITRYRLPQKWALFHLPHSAPYYNGRICLLGDSAHATTPHLGAGAGMAMEDAYVLSNLIACVQDVADIESAFQAYDRVRRPRTQRLIEYSRSAGLAVGFSLPDAKDAADILKDRVETWYEWLWHEDLEAQFEQAKKLLQR